MSISLLLVVLLFVAGLSTGHSCTQGFPTLEQLQQLAGGCDSGGCAKDTGNNGDGRNFVIPGMSFTCNGTITKWTVAGDVVEGTRDTTPARLQIWRQLSSNSYSTVEEFPLLECMSRWVQVATNVYQCTSTQGVSIQANDILGIYLSSSHTKYDQFAVYFHTSSTDPPVLTTHSVTGIQSAYPFAGGITDPTPALPLVAFEISNNAERVEGALPPPQTKIVAATPSVTLDMADRVTPLITPTHTETVIQTTVIPIETMTQPTETVMPIETMTQPTETVIPIETITKSTETVMIPIETMTQPTETVMIPIETMTQSTEIVIPIETMAQPTETMILMQTMAPPIESPIPTRTVTGTMMQTMIQTKIEMQPTHSVTPSARPIEPVESPTTPVVTSVEKTTTLHTESEVTTDDIPVDPSQTNNLPVIVTVGTIITVLLLSLIGTCAAFFLQYQFRWRRTTVKISSKTEPSDLSQFRNPTYFDVGARVEEDLAANSGNYEEIQMVIIPQNVTYKPTDLRLSVRDTCFHEPGTTDKSRLSAMEFELMNNPKYSFGLHVPSMEQRMSLKCQDNESAYATLVKHQKGSDAPMRYFSEEEQYWAPASDSNTLYRQLSSHKYREIMRYQIRVIGQIGSGQFGSVGKGIWHISPDNMLDCAVKTLHAGATAQESLLFLQEAAINGQFHHPNVVQLLGVVTVGSPVMIILELLSNGDLLNYLHRIRPSPGELVASDMPQLLLRFCQQVAAGMEYLARKGFVHRDLAARNILVTEDKICKISDFGLSRRAESGDYYVSSGGRIPVKWTAPEALYYKKYSTASDVWSFGALMYEIWSLGHKPFEDYDNPEVVRIVNTGYRLPPPPGCPKVVYRLMIQCWHPTSKQRPSFHHIGERLNVTVVDLMTSEEDACDPSAMTIGAPLSTATGLYVALQQTYC